MVAVYLKKYRSMILCSIFFFYLGCGVTLSLLKMDCAEATKGLNSKYLKDSDANTHSDVEYAVVILSAKDHINTRMTIRSTWMRLAGNIVIENSKRFYKWRHSAHRDIYGDPPKPDFLRYYFVIGIKGLNLHDTVQLMSEHSTTKDLLLLPDVEESYAGLSVKMLKTLEWFNDNLKNLKYLIKCDEDSFVRIDLIVNDLEAYAPSMHAPEIAEYVSFKEEVQSDRGLYWGYFNGQAHVYNTGKWKEKEWFICDNYLPYALGGGYVISKKVVQFVGSNSNSLTPYKSEDVSMGLWTAALKGINRVHDIRFDTEWKSRGCSNDMLVRHRQNSSQIVDMYFSLKDSKGKKLCLVTSEIRKSYQYNWDVLPSRCCKSSKL